MPFASDDVIPDAARRRVVRIYDEYVEPIQRRVPYVHYASPKVTDKYLDYLRRAERVLDVPPDVQDQVEQLLNERGQPAFGVRLIGDQDTQAEDPPTTASFDLLHTRRYDP